MFRRERLLGELDRNTGVACTWIAGPPGSGKTVLLAGFADDRPAHLWYQIDSDDGDPPALFARLTAASHANLGAAAQDLPRYTSDAAFSVLTFARQFFRRLYALAPQLLIALDDYHEAAVDCPLHDIVRVAIEHAPAGVHIAVASRAHPPAALARCQANGMLRAMSWNHLMLTADEVIGVAGMHNIVLDHHAAERWHRRCGGWAAGLRLLLKSGAALLLAADHVESRTLVFDYLGQEVFRGLPAPAQSALLRLAFLPRIPADVVNDLAGSPTAERQLAELAHENLFTAVSDAGPRTYRFHPLFRDFLIHQATLHLPEHEVAALRHRSAVALEARGLVEEAAQVLMTARSWPALSQLVLRHAPALMQQSRQATLAQWLTALPPGQVDEDPWLLYWLGACRSMQDPASARAHIEAAYRQFTGRHEQAGLLLAWSGVVDCIFRVYANLGQLDEWIERLDGMLGPDARFPSPEIEARVTFSMFTALSFRQPHAPGLAIWRQRLDAMADAVPDPTFRLLSRMHLTVDPIWQGRMQDAGVELERLRRETTRLPPGPLVELVRHFADATFALYAGEVQHCFEAIENALALADESGIHMWDKILLGQGAALALSYGELDRARRYVERRSAIVTPADDEEQSLHHTLQAWSCWLGAMPAEALARVQLGEQFSRRMGLPYFNAVGRLSLSIVSFECGDQDGALRQVFAARALGTQIGNPMIGWMADLLEAYMRLRRGDGAAQLIESFAAVGSEHGYRHFFFWPRQAVALVCFKVLERGIQPDYARALIENGRLEPPPQALQSDRWPWPVKITTLGRFKVVVRGSPIEFKGKAQHAPMNLLKALIAFGPHDVTETRLVDALWPDADGPAGEQALATTLFRLRKLVGADVVKRQDGHLSIVASTCWVDCWALQRLLNSAAPEGELLIEQTRRFYAGPFLDSEADAPWALQLRERLHVALVKKLLAAAADALAHARVELALAICDAGLEIDDLVEDFYRGQIHCHIAKDQPSRAVTSYRRCQRVLQHRLGVEPSAATTRLYLSALRRSDA
ncbi:MAG: hypothetical protein KGL99_13265 [Burkholderiales bacterium]|nr:hypothetical protein [Burkholderiales bacterium]